MWCNLMKILIKLFRSRDGASAAEYALILAVLGAVIISGLTALGGGVRNSFGKTANHLNTGT